jgi:hypothetical protein
MNALTMVVVVSAAVLFASKPVRCQTDRVDNKYLDPNDYFLAGGNQQDRRRIQDAFNRYGFHYCEFTCFRVLTRLAKISDK